MKVLLTFLFISSTVGATTAAFEQNLGQAGKRARYFTSTPTTSVLFTGAGVEFLAANAAGKEETLRLSFPGGNSLSWQASEPFPETYHYQLGGPADRNASGVRRFKRIESRNVYPGIDLVFYFSDLKLEYDFVVQPGADPSQIQLEFAGPRKIQLSSLGDFESSLVGHRWLQRAPIVHQDNRTVASSWKSEGGQRYRFSAGRYDASKALTIDPVLEFASYLGGDDDDEITSIGESFVAGNTTSVLFDGINGRPRQGRDVFIRIQASPNINPLAYQPWRDQVFIFGGSGDDTLVAATVSLSSQSVSMAYAGTTSSRDMPFGTSPSKYNGGPSDGYAGSYLIIQEQPGRQQVTSNGTYYGGSGTDRVMSAMPSLSRSYLAGVTDSPDLPIRRATQTAPGGGLDGFYAFVESTAADPISVSSYLGGAGNDQALVIRFSNMNTLLIGGETRSDSVAQIPGTLSGPSDAFVLEIGPLYVPLTATLVNEVPVVRARRFGGSGEDRLTAISASGANLVYAGETSSTDFPTQSPAQPQSGGGVDAFVLRYSASGADLLSSTYFGGSGEETVRAASSLASGEVLIAGDSTSSNLTTRDPLQAANQGGRDGFYAFYDRTGGLESASYYGGSGDESIYSAFLPFTGPFRLGGATTSPNLPERNAWRQGAPGGLNGFAADISLPFLNAGDVVWAAPNLTSTINYRTLQPIRSTLFTARIADPSLATFVLGDQRLSEVTFSPNSGLAIQGLREQGETTITLSAPGYNSRQIRLRLGRAVVSISNPSSRVSIFQRGLEFRPRVEILDTATGQLVAQDGFSINTFSVPITWRSSDPAIFRAANSNVGNILLIPNGIGTANLLLESRYPSFPEGGLAITVEPGVLGDFSTLPPVTTPLNTSTISVTSTASFGGFDSQIWGTFRIESEDPTRLLIGTSQVDATPAIDTFIEQQRAGYNLSFEVYALASSGSARVRISSPFLAQDTFVVVQLRPLLIDIGTGGFNNSISFDITSLPNSRLTLGATIRPDYPGYGTVQPRIPIELSLESTNSQVARISPTNWAVGGSSGVLPNLEILGPGTAQIRVSSSSPHVRIGSIPKVTVANRIAFPLQATPTITPVGHRLSTAINSFLSTNLNQQSEVELSVDDPSLVGISINANDSPAASIRLRPFTQINFFVHGLASSGSTNIRSRSATFEEIVYPVRLGPAGIAFSEERRVVDIATPQFTATAGVWVLDETTLQPLQQQSLQPGVTANFQFASSSPELQISRTSCTLTGGVVCSFGVTATAIGENSIRLDAAAGFVTPATRQRLNVLAQRTPISNPFFYGVKDCLVPSSIQTPFTFQQSSQNVRPITVQLTSLDPELVQFSTAADQPGQTTITFDTTRTFYIHGMGPTGAARFRIEGPNITTVESSMQVYNWSFSLDRVSSFSQLPTDTLLAGTKNSYYLTLRGTNGGATAGTRPGIAPIRVEAQIQNPAILGFQLTEGQPVFPPDTGRITGELTARSTGSSSITFLSGSIRSEIPAFNVRLPRLLGVTPLMTPNTRGTVTLRMESGAPIPVDNTLFTVRSLNPSRLLVQNANSGAPGNASATALWPVNSGTTSFEVDSLGVSDGQSEFEISLAGFENFVGTVYHATPALTFATSDLRTVLTLGNDLPFGLVQSFLPRGDLAGRSDVTTQSTRFRPGFDPSTIEIRATSDDPSVLTVEDPPARLGDFPNGRPLLIRSRGVGTTTVRLLPPPGFGTLPDGFSSRVVRVQAPSLGINCSGQVPYEAISTCSVAAPANVPLTVRSENAGRLLVSQSATSPAQQQIVLPAGSGVAQLAFHGQARSGSTKVTFSAPGYLDSVLDIGNTNSAFVLTQAAPDNQPTPVAVNGQLSLSVRFYAVDGNGRPTYQIFGGLRPGAIPAVVSVRVSDPSVLTVSPGALTFNPLDSEKTITVRGVKSGSASVELGTPAGFAPPVPVGVLVRVN